jgi:hypothetical protein
MEPLYHSLGRKRALTDDFDGESRVFMPVNPQCRAGMPNGLRHQRWGGGGTPSDWKNAEA